MIEATITIGIMLIIYFSFKGVIKAFQNAKTINDNDDFCKGEIVFMSVKSGYIQGKISEIKIETEEEPLQFYPVIVEFDNFSLTFTSNGKFCKDGYRTLFHEWEVKI